MGRISRCCSCHDLKDTGNKSGLKACLDLEQSAFFVPEQSSRQQEYSNIKRLRKKGTGSLQYVWNHFVFTQFKLALLGSSFTNFRALYPAVCFIFLALDMAPRFFILVLFSGCLFICYFSTLLGFLLPLIRDFMLLWTSSFCGPLPRKSFGISTFTAFSYLQASCL